MATRALKTPGLAAAQVPAADPPDTGEDMSDDLERFESEGLPAANMGDVQIQLAEERAARRALERKVEQMAATKADKPGAKAEPVVSTEEARRMASEMVAQGLRPRAILTPEGWYVHPEIARVAVPGA